jgi:pantoate--beta-alanine ligase
MRVIENLKEMTETARGWLAGGTVGFVPIRRTPLHDGHKLLIQAAKRASQITVVGLLDNICTPETPKASVPGQHSLVRNLQVLGNNTIDIVFIPRREEMYPPDYTTVVTPPQTIIERLDGATRENLQHFATLALKLLHLVRPDVVYYAQKDAQHIAIVQQLMLDLNIDARISVQPTARAGDGLAISNRTGGLSLPERQAAALIYQALLHGKALIERGERHSAAIKQAIANVLQVNPLITRSRIDICSPDTFAAMELAQPGTLLRVSVHIGSIHFTDNILWRSNGQWSL